MLQEELKKNILLQVGEYASQKLAEKKFVPGETYIRTSGEVFSSDEFEMLVGVALGGWYTEGAFSADFSKDLRAYLDNQVRHVILCNSGSSANLLAVSAITQPEFGEKRAKPGDEIITCVVGFPTTVSPIIQNNLIPVFVDMNFPNYAPDPTVIEHAVTDKTKGIILAHTLGNPFNVDAIRDICDEYGLWMISDCCDALGSKYNGKHVGTVGDISTVSFFPAHQVTTAEGGCIFTDSPMVKKVIDSLRSWGRDCYCLPGKDNTCGKRFGQQLGTLPFGYDHKYCVPLSTRIETEKGLLSVSDLLGTKFSVATLSENGIDWRSATIHPVKYQGTLKIYLENGMILCCGKDHPVLTSNGYIEADRLSTNDTVAVAGVLPDRVDANIPDEIITLAGMVISDGTYLENSKYIHAPISWYKANEECRQVFIKSLEQLNISYRIDAKGYIFPHGGKLQDHLDALGWKKAKSENKTIPDGLRGLSRRQSGILLRSLWSGDGTAKIKPDGTSARILYSSRSEELCLGIQRLLFQHSILSTVTKTLVTYKNEKLPYFYVTVVGFESKQKMICLLDGSPRYGNLDYLYSHIMLSETRKRGGARNPILDGNVWWVKVCDVSEFPKELVYDISVNDSAHNFVADGVVTHNCFSRLGYNLQITDLQSAIGIAQVKKLPGFVEARKHNWQRLYDGMKQYDDFFILPESTENSEPSWFGFLLTLKKTSPFTRGEIVHYLEEHKVGTRMLFGGNLLRHPAFIKAPHRVFGRLDNANVITEASFWVGVYPGINDAMIDYMLGVFGDFLGKYKGKAKK